MDDQSKKAEIITLINESISKEIVDNDTINRITPLTGDASSRSYYRVSTSKKNFIVCMDIKREIEKKDFALYQVYDLLYRNNIKVPKILDIDLPKGYILLEDLGDTTLLQFISRYENSFKQLDIYQNCIDIIIKFQNLKLDSSKKEKPQYLELCFDTDKYMYEFNFTNQYFLQDLLKVNLSKHDLSILNKSFKTISSFLESHKMVFVHRDFHSRNIMVQDKDFYTIDYQDARLGNPLYDLVSLLEDCYFKIDDNVKEKLKSYFYNNHYKQSFNLDFDFFNKHYEYMKVQRVYKAIGSFSYIYKTRQDERYLKFIGFSFERFRESLIKLPEFEDLYKVIADLYYGS